MNAKQLLSAIKSWKDDELDIKIKTNGKAIDIDKVVIGDNGKELWLVPDMFDEEDSPYEGLDDMDM